MRQVLRAHSLVQLGDLTEVCKDGRLGLHKVNRKPIKAEITKLRSVLSQLKCLPVPESTAAGG